MLRSVLRIVAVCALLAGCAEHSTEPEDDKCLCPAATLRLDSVSVLNGQTVSVNLRMELSHDAAERLDSIGSLDLLIAYDKSTLSFLDADPGPEIGPWEWFTYRHHSVDMIPGISSLLRVLAIRDLDNGPDVHPSSRHIPEGVLLRLNFYVTANRSYIGTCALIHFAILDCFDNCIGSMSGDKLYLANLDIGTPFVGPDCRPPACEDEYREDRATVESVLELRSGRICIREPPDDRPLTGDLNLNGIAFEVADAVIFADYLIYGESALDPDPSRRARQIMAGDIDGDGVPLTQADYDEMVRIIDGGP
ncbi:MAG TPA: hypothetical protein VM118_11990 [Acidobacteriota bacterium]|nr:hypothetical protein [Acidobacteriota bacterium]